MDDLGLKTVINAVEWISGDYGYVQKRPVAKKT
jgi:hypothetical protein